MEGSLPLLDGRLNMVRKAQTDKREVNDLRAQLEREAIQFGITGDPRPLLRAAMMLYLRWQVSSGSVSVLDMGDLTPTDVTEPIDPTENVA
jgi:hypothetical protein